MKHHIVDRHNTLVTISGGDTPEVVATIKSEVSILAQEHLYSSADQDFADRYLQKWNPQDINSITEFSILGFSIVRQDPIGFNNDADKVISL